MANNSRPRGFDPMQPIDEPSALMQPTYKQSASVHPLDKHLAPVYLSGEPAAPGEPPDEPSYLEQPAKVSLSYKPGTYINVAHGSEVIPAVVDHWPYVRFFKHHKRLNLWSDGNILHSVIWEDVREQLAIPKLTMRGSRLYYDETPFVASRGKKRPVDQTMDDSDEFGQGIQKMLECFGSDYIKNAIQSKKKRLEQLTQGALKASSKTVDDVWKAQNIERQRLQDEYCKQVSSVFQQWESDLEKTKDQEAKLTLLYKQQQKLFEQARAVQSQRLKTLKQLHTSYVMGMEDLERNHQSQASNAQAELKKEMSLLQKKILMDTQQQEMANVRKSLQTMLF